MAENHTHCSFLKRLPVFLNGCIAYFLFMAVIVTAEIVIATVVLAFLPMVREETPAHKSVTLEKNCRGYNEPDDYSTDWNVVMEKPKCCGVKNYTDFSGSSFEMRTGYTYPRSCCKSIGAAACNGHDVSPDVIYQEGCFPTLLKITKTQSFRLSPGSLGAAVLQAFMQWSAPGALHSALWFWEVIVIDWREKSYPRQRQDDEFFTHHYR